MKLKSDTLVFHCGEKQIIYFEPMEGEEGAQNDGFNPLKSLTPDEVITLFANIAKIELTKEDRATARKIITQLSKETAVLTGIVQFIESWNSQMAQDLGITEEQWQALKPIFSVMAEDLGRDWFFTIDPQE